VRSNLGKGSIFSVFLPAHGAAAQVRDEDPHATTTQPLIGFRAPRLPAPTEPPRS
jgi:hypothetical protein